MSTRRPSIFTLAATVALLGLVGCSTPDSSPREEGSSKVTPPGEGASPTQANSREVPAACAGLDLSLGAQLEGTALGGCVASALSSYGSGKMKIAGDATGDFEFTYDPGFNVQGEMQSATGTVKVALLDDEIWIDSGSGPVKGNPESENEEEVMAALVGELTRFYADLSQTAQLVEAQPVWTVDDSFASVTQVSGEQTKAYRIGSAAPFDWNGVPIAEFVLWFGEDWVPLSTEASSEMMGAKATNSQQFYDLGEPVTITPLG